jgi:hypothetical protein
MALNHETVSDRRAQSIVVACKCGASLEAGRADAGARLHCPNCGSFVVIPPLSSFAPLPLRSDEAGPTSKLPVKRRLQFSVQTLLLVICAIGLFLALVVQLRVRDLDDDIAPIDHSWTTGSMRVRAEARSMGGHYITVEGDWSAANPDYMIRYSMWLTSRSGKTVFVAGASQKLKSVNDGTFYDPPAPPFGGASFRVECDYEIWTGAPGKSKLLAKNSGFLPWHDK